MQCGAGCAVRAEHYEAMNRRLTIRLSRQSLSFSTVEGGEVVYEPYALKAGMSAAANMREALRTATMAAERFERVTVLLDARVLMVPMNMYSEEDAQLLFSHTYTAADHRVVVSHVLPELNAVAVFDVERDLRQVLEERYGQVRLVPVCAPVWHHLYRRSFTGMKQKLYGYFHDQRMEVFAFQQGRFRFQNQYQVREQGDVMYFLLSVWKQLGMDAREDELHLSGDVPEREALTEELKRYVKRVLVGNPTGEFNRAQVTLIEGVPYDLMVYFLKGL